MIRELELEAAIAEASTTVGAGDVLSYAYAAIDLPPVRAYAQRFAQVMDAAERPRDEAIASAFLLAFRLGVLAARNERMDG